MAEMDLSNCCKTASKSNAPNKGTMVTSRQSPRCLLKDKKHINTKVFFLKKTVASSTRVRLTAGERGDQMVLFFIMYTQQKFAKLILTRIDKSHMESLDAQVTFWQQANLISIQFALNVEFDVH